jgi:hypothetical protein
LDSVIRREIEDTYLHDLAPVERRRNPASRHMGRHRAVAMSPRQRHPMNLWSGLRFGMKFGNPALAYQAAIDGLGVAIAQAERMRDMR